MNQRTVETVCPRNCYGGCTIKVTIEGNKIIKVEGNNTNNITRGKICLKGLSYPQLIYNENRLLYPLKRKGERSAGQFERISWDEAVDTIYDKFKAIGRSFGPEAILYYTGSGNLGGAMESYALGFWNQLDGYSTIRGGLCDTAGTQAIRFTFGEVKHNKLTDLHATKLIILWGKNPAYTNVHSMLDIQKAIMNGAKLVTIDPRKNESSNKSTLHIMPRCGTDGLLALGIAKLLIKDGLIDIEFIRKYTYGFEQYKKLLEDYSIEEVCRITEVDIVALQKLVELIREAGRFALILGKGFQRYSNGGQTTRAICLLAALTGSVGKSGSGLYFGDTQRPKQVWPYTPPLPQRYRNDINMGQLAQSIFDAKNPSIKAVWVERANPITSNPNGNKLKRALDSMEFLICADHFMTDTAKMADIVLPAAMFLEENDIVRSYGHSYIQFKQKALEPPGECRTDKDIYHMLGIRFDMDMTYLPEDDEQILRDVIKASGYKTTLQKLRKEPYLFPEYNEIAFADMMFKTKSGKIEFLSQPFSDAWGVPPLPVYIEPVESQYSDPGKFARYPFHFMSAHAKERINSQFTYSEWLTEVTQPEVVINVSDANEKGISNGDAVRIFNERGEIFAQAKVGCMIKKGCVNVFEGWPSDSGASVNLLTEERMTDVGYGTAYHNCLVQIEKVD